MYLVDYHTHPYAHGNQLNYNENLFNKFLMKARKRNISEIGFSDHDDYHQNINWKLMKKVKKNSPIPVLFGLEIDYAINSIDKIKSLIEMYNLDYTIGSVHFIDEWPFDHPNFKNEYSRRDIDQSYIKYFNMLDKLVTSNLFNIVGHFDLIKVFGYKPVNINIMEIITPILKKIKSYDLAVEINTNGLNKPIKEIYPSIPILEKIYELNIPITIGSDAHSHERVGENIDKYIKIAEHIGFKELATFRNRKMILKSIR
ncbi:MAG: histidinol-phosphatase HisJ family protein [bacterium]